MAARSQRSGDAETHSTRSNAKPQDSIPSPPWRLQQGRPHADKLPSMYSMDDRRPDSHQTFALIGSSRSGCITSTKPITNVVCVGSTGTGRYGFRPVVRIAKVTLAPSVERVTWRIALTCCSQTSITQGVIRAAIASKTMRSNVDSRARSSARLIQPRNTAVPINNKMKPSPISNTRKSNISTTPSADVTM